MDGMHDLGGKQGFGPVQHSAQAVVFHDEWEKRINALYGVAVRAGIFNMDQYRHAIERMEPTHYMSAGYYERTLTSLATLCVEKGLVSLIMSAGTCACPATFAARSAWLRTFRPATRFQTLTHTLCRQMTSPRLTCALKAQICGLTPLTRLMCTWAFFKAI